MRHVRIFAHTSLDGVIQPVGESDWAKGGWSAPYRSPAGAQMLAEAQGSPFDLVLGRVTYDLWGSFWPTVKGGPFAEALNGATKYVATHRPEGLGWKPAQSLGPDAIEGLRALKATDGPDLLVWGSTTLIPSILANRLVDEVVLLVYPLLLGEGKRYFSGADTHELALVSTKTSPTGVLINSYKYLGKPKGAP